MASREKITLINDQPFANWIGFSRTAQAFVAIIVLGLDAYVIGEWNSNQFNFNYVFGQAGSLNLKTDVGSTPFTGIVMFTVRHPPR